MMGMCNDENSTKPCKKMGFFFVCGIYRFQKTLKTKRKGQKRFENKIVLNSVVVFLLGTVTTSMTNKQLKKQIKDHANN